MRDSQRSKVLRAEREAFGAEPLNYYDFVDDTQAAMRIYHWINPSKCRDRFGFKNLVVGRLSKKQVLVERVKARLADKWFVRLPREKECQPHRVMHQLVHAILGHDLHNEEFCSAYLYLVLQVRTVKHRDLLWKAFLKHRVKFNRNG